MAFAPVNPADLLELRSQYGGQRVYPFVPGAEGAGHVEAVGENVTGVAPGDLVVCMTRGNWLQRRVLDADDVFVVPFGVSASEAAVLRVNPATARLLLEDAEPQLRPSDVVVVNAANSVVGRLLVHRAAGRGFQVVAVVRRPELHQGLIAQGASHVLRDDDALCTQLRHRYPDGAAVAFDCVAGASSERLVNCLRVGGRLVVYGHQSGDPCRIPSRRLTFGAIQVSGFNLGRALSAMSPADIRVLYRELADAVPGDRPSAVIDHIFDLADLHAALAYAENPLRDGRVLIRLSPKASQACM